MGSSRSRRSRRSSRSFGQPFPVAIGLLIAVAEIAIGLGALSGLLFRLSAVGGFALSILFWLTASWATKPYYYGPDLPYALGWLTLALAGTGGRYTIEAWLDREFDGGLADEPVSPERRLVLKAGFLGVAAIAVAGLAGTVGASVLGQTADRRRRRRTRRSIPATHGRRLGIRRHAVRRAAAGCPGKPGRDRRTRPRLATPAPPTGPLVAKVSQLGIGPGRHVRRSDHRRSRA